MNAETVLPAVLKSLVVDDVVPVANCDAHTVVALTNDGPFGITLVQLEYLMMDLMTIAVL
jgi:hypothetical protein